MKKIHRIALSYTWRVVTRMDVLQKPFALVPVKRTSIDMLMQCLDRYRNQMNMFLLPCGGQGELLSVLVANLNRFDEKVKEDADGIHKLMGR